MFANFLLDKANFLDRDIDSDDDEPASTGLTVRTGNSSRSRERKGVATSYPAFEEYLEARPEIKRILSRRTLD